ncbi:sodium/calcium exchanger 3-like isoform X2 [Stegodyphus dumicola]|uniref:sodium/calcium exchanger 3-like isoform X2 n=1 Tax=Stegodyphus dumicola TaxID=202533 RepID=UPI0015A7BAF1|nr:sodium/calcium exchanger 3-like isoform X2 [Stegodyphus dumicola]
MSSRASTPKRWLWVTFFFFTCIVAKVNCEKEYNISDLYGPIKCREGLILPVWCPQENLSRGDIVARGIVYFVALAYLFVGVSIVADRFMASIEVITSKEKEVVIKKPNGETQNISVRIWNETVSNLTLMALGSSAPEILLSIIEVYAQDFEAGELGPGTIVGSAAFNMFVIIGICVWSVPTTENRKIKHLRVFFVTMTWSVFAYIWLYLILTLFSPGVIDVWEGLVTFMFFPATVLTAYIADRQFLIYKYMTKKYHMNKRNVIVGGEGGEDLEMGMTKTNHLPDGNVKNYEEEQSDDIREFEEHRMQYIQILRELRRKHPDATMEDIEMMAREEILDRGPKSRAYYRIQATRKLMGGANLMKRKLEKIEKKDDDEAKEERPKVVSLFFDPGHYTVMENVGEFAVTVCRDGNLSEAVAVDYRTEDGTANAGSDYEEAEGTLIFGPGETQKQFFITVIDDDVFEEDEHFYVRLLNPRYTIDKMESRMPVELATPFLATVMILDDDHAGIFLFPETEVEVSESVGEYALKVNRFSGARGRVILPFRTVEGTAKPGVEYEHMEGELIFENNETSKEIPLHIIDNESYEADATFYVELGDPKLEEDVGLAENQDYLREQSGQDLNENQENLSEDEKIALLGKPRLGEHYKVQIRIKESREFKNTVDKLFQKANVSLSIGTSSWKEQFLEAITVSAGDDDDEEEGEEEGEEGEEKEPKLPTCSDYVMHFITLFWKLLFALIPPADMLDGWLCFVVSIFGIGILTAVIGDLASHFGCTVGLKDTVTAVALVALGTSIPDTFASKVAAIQDKYADSSIGNVTGSNAVNVFLGIGIAWSITAIVHYARGTQFKVEPGSLAFSVTMFCACAFISCVVLLLRRSKRVGGELGGPLRFKLPTTILFVSLWLFYVIMSSLEAYGYIEGF